MATKLIRFQKIHGHPWIRAVGDFDHHGLIVRGIKLEQHRDEWRVAAPGRRVDGAWQTMFGFVGKGVEDGLLSLMLRHYEGGNANAAVAK